MSIEHHVHAPSTGRESGKSSVIQVPPSLVTIKNQTLSPPLSGDGLAAPENITSVPNPFAVALPDGAMPITVSESSMASGNWGSSSPVTHLASNAPLLAASYPPSSPQSYPLNTPQSGNPVMIAASGIRVAGTQSKAPAPAPSKKKASPQKKEPSNNRRQKRLERNRESARLSRRRRKQYLEVLEDRVSQLSFEMDTGRREHVAAAIPQLQEQRQEALKNKDLDALEMDLSRSSDELRIAATFQSQQLQSLVFPPHAKFLLWLSLQTDAYFRGGRAASERLSAARIGERVS